MTNALQRENRELKKQLKAFVAQARENENKLQRFNKHELELISATSFHELISLILHHYPQTFNLDCISLTLLDPEYELLRILEASGHSLEQTPGLQIETDASHLTALFGASPRPRLGAFVTREHLHRFPPQPHPIRSRAFLPLIRRGELIGSLNMGSYQSELFTQGSATDFLERLAAVVAVCLENCANHQRLKQLGLTDPLTRVNNRRYFDQRLTEELSLARRHRQPLGCMFLDVDHFKKVNDNFGHQAGDQVLQEMAMVINSQLRHSDVLSRYGGEEFVVLLPASNPEECYEIAERIRRTIERHPFRITENETLSLTLSAGVNGLRQIPSGKDNAELAATLVAGADEAVYLAKQGGRNRVEIEQMEEEKQTFP